MDAVFLLIGFVLGWAIGSKITSALHVMSFKKIMQELNISEQQLKLLAERNGFAVPDDDATEPELEQCEVRIEQHADQLYAYRKSDDQFLGQGTDRDSLIDRLNQTMKPCRVLIDKEDGADLLQKSHS